MVHITQEEITLMYSFKHLKSNKPNNPNNKKYNKIINRYKIINLFQSLIFMDNKI